VLEETKILKKLQYSGLDTVVKKSKLSRIRIPNTAGYAPVGGILVDAQLQILAELLVELLVVVLVLGHLLNELNNL
jgi:hypothetical protein